MSLPSPKSYHSEGDLLKCKHYESQYMYVVYCLDF